MRTFPQGVVVVTASDDEGPRGITVSSFTSISLTPPLVLICIKTDARAHAAIDRGRFVVNVLAEDQGSISDHFATPNLTSEQQFTSIPFESAPPRLEGCLGYLDCQVVARIPQGDHTIFVGEVSSSKLGRDAKPLVFHSRQYWGLGATVYQRG
jgi:flavin reductase (DIM6/NTAB) family NADH-FMN oxidoreductase RutF